MCAKRYHRAATEPFTSVYVKAPVAYIVCVRGMGNLVEHWFGLLFRVHADNNTDAESQDCDEDRHIRCHPQATVRSHKKQCAAGSWVTSPATAPAAQ